MLEDIDAVGMQRKSDVDEMEEEERKKKTEKDKDKGNTAGHTDDKKEDANECDGCGSNETDAK
ncbi:MAG: hypothetical protein CL912_01695, partial [Deltaproteobacteria bacterium]|nr:hypothetical protein [Deltaproteobacteria bacterium]